MLPVATALPHRLTPHSLAVTLWTSDMAEATESKPEATEAPAAAEAKDETAA